MTARGRAGWGRFWGRSNPQRFVGENVSGREEEQLKMGGGFGNEEGGEMAIGVGGA